MALLVAAIEKKPNEAAWMVLFDSMVDYGTNVDDVAKRRGFVNEDDGKKVRFARVQSDGALAFLRAAFEKASVGGRLALLVELVVDGHPDKDLLEGCDVDVKALEVEARAAVKAKREGEAAAKLIRWDEPKKGKVVGHGGSGRLYTISEAVRGFSLAHTGNNGALSGTGAGGSTGHESIEKAKASALEHEKHRRGAGSAKAKPAAKAKGKKAPEPVDAGDEDLGDEDLEDAGEE
jgi:hypothetical protein